MAESAKRIKWIDMLRGAAMILVVLGHMNYPKGETVKLYIYSFHMPLFFIISGITYALSTKELHFKDFAFKKAKTLLIPYFLWNFITLPYWYYNTRILKGSSTPLITAVKGIFYCNENYYSGPTNATWFLATLFLVEILFYLFLKWSKGDQRDLTIAIAICAVMGHFASFSTKMPPWHIDALPTALVFFWFGYIFMKNFSFIKKKFTALSHYKIIYAVTIALLFYIGRWFALQNGRSSMVLTQYNDFFYYYIAALATSFAVIMLIVILPDIPPVTFIGRNTITYVALHCMMLRTLENYNEATVRLSSEHPYITALLIILILVPICFIVNKVFPFLVGKKYSGKRKKTDAAL